MALKLEIGQRFNSFQEFYKFFKEYCKQERQVFGIRDSHKIKSHHGIKLDLIYRSLLYGCKFGKQLKPSRGKGIRRRRYGKLIWVQALK